MKRGQHGHPCYIGSGSSTLFAWYHEPPGTVHRGQGIVLCPPIGLEAVNAHRMYRILAERLAETGFPVVRFDYRDSGDSFGEVKSPSEVASEHIWIADIATATEALSRFSGVTRTSFFGLRLGATLAAVSAAHLGRVDSLVLWSPYKSWASYLRDMRLSGFPAADRESSSRIVSPADPRSGNLIHFQLTKERDRSIDKLSLTEMDTLPSPNVFLLGRGTVAEEQIATRLKQLGAAVVQQHFKGLTCLDAPPHRSDPRKDLIDQIVSMWGNLYPPTPLSPHGIHPSSQFRRKAHPPQRFVEQAISFGYQNKLFGILTQPADDSPTSSFAVLLLNAGCVYHVGPNRLHVGLARQWTDLGLTTLRFDLSGIGDSRPDFDCEENLECPPQVTRDVRDAMAAVRQMTGISKFVLVGICSGAFNSFRVALSDPNVTGVVLVNPSGVSFEHEPKLKNYIRRATFVKYVRAIFHLSSWYMLISGRLQWLFVKRNHRGADSSLVINLARLPEKIDTLLVYSQNELGLEYLKSVCVDQIRNLADKRHFRLAVVEKADHAFFQIRSRQKLQILLFEDMQTRLGMRVSATSCSGVDRKNNPTSDPL